VEVDNVITVLKKEIKNARIIGLKQWEGKKAIVIIEGEDNGQ